MAPGFGYGAAQDSGGYGDDLEYYAVGLGELGGISRNGVDFHLGEGGGGRGRRGRQTGGVEREKGGGGVKGRGKLP